MAEVLSTPQFQVLTHQYTGEKIGRIYFPALFLTEFHVNLATGEYPRGKVHTSVTQWLQQQKIMFGEADLKQYGDGSFRLYFRVSNALEGEYFRLVNFLIGKSRCENKEKS
ncbi:hypothetical protein [Calothrix sp. UHCC 0171]|uniref:hypothetical protein n=1 Tax=Calothrix sp. UHCC 0171 TaxID=3110245 RepID=UPI002B206BDA|nr:hypothetical protein [Calothrix sp. UHCC 0171]MEA5573462.1 hypothetical protein [Calothrix sp. UHCC 0171]